MTRFPKELTENGIHYTLHGDCYFPERPSPILCKPPKQGVK